MKSNPLATILLAVLAVSAVASAILGALYVQNNRELRALQSQVGQVNNNRNLLNALAQDCLEYSKTHQAIDPILESVGLKAKPAATSATKPATK
jgi:Na+-transporting NADH:ubiquinone oxidoreductase subunit NqrC